MTCTMTGTCKMRRWKVYEGQYVDDGRSNSFGETKPAPSNSQLMRSQQFARCKFKLCWSEISVAPKNHNVTGDVLVHAWLCEAFKVPPMLPIEPPRALIVAERHKEHVLLKMQPLK